MELQYNYVVGVVVAVIISSVVSFIILNGRNRKNQIYYTYVYIYNSIMDMRLKMIPEEVRYIKVVSSCWRFMPKEVKWMGHEQISDMVSNAEKSISKSLLENDDIKKYYRENVTRGKEDDVRG